MNYYSICQSSTSLIHRNLGLDVSIYLSITLWKILFRSLTVASFKESRSVIFVLGIHFAPGVFRSKYPLGSNMDYLVASDGAPIIKVVSCFSTFEG